MTFSHPTKLSITYKNLKWDPTSRPKRYEFDMNKKPSKILEKL
jgi:hypothetical protein